MRMNRNKKIYHRPVTNHAKERFNERTEVSEKDFLDTSKRAFQFGYKLRRFKGEFYEYVRSKQINGGHYSVRVYEDNVYIFDTHLGRMLTVYPVPAEFLPVSNWFVGVDDTFRCIIIAEFPDGHVEYVCDNGVLTDDIGLATEFRTEQRANNYIKNNNYLSILAARGTKFTLLPL